MAEDHSQRPYRSSETIARTGQPRGAAPGGAAPTNDPLAELARLIGQTDPFGDGMNAPSRRPESAGAAPAVDWSAPSTQPSHQQSFAPADFGPAAHPGAHQPGQPYYAHQTWTQFEEPPQGEAAYQPEQEIPSYLTGRAAQDAHGHEAYAADEQFEPGHDDYYDEAPPRGRGRVLLLAAVFGLAVLGTAGAFGYRTLFGSGTRVPPVIQADKSPLKVVPENASAQGGKAIADRVTDQGEKILPREEKPVDITQLVQASAPPQASAGNGVVAGEPKKVHTITIRPDGSAGQPVAMASPMPPENAVPQAAPPLAPAQSAPAAAPPQRAKADRESAPRAAQQQESNNAPLSLAPETAPASRPVRTANAAPTASAPTPQAHVTAYAVQVASQKTEAEAKAAYQAILKKYPQVLEGKNMFVYSVDLGTKGTYYRAMIGPYSVATEATEICSALKSAGGSCLIQRN